MIEHKSDRSDVSKIPWDGINITLPTAQGEHNLLTDQARLGLILKLLGTSNSKTVGPIELIPAPESGRTDSKESFVTIARVMKEHDDALFGYCSGFITRAIELGYEYGDGFWVWLQDKADWRFPPTLEILPNGAIWGNTSIYRPDDIIMALVSVRDSK